MMSACHTTAGMLMMQPVNEERVAPDVQSWGWYLYGIIQQRPEDAWEAGAHLRHQAEEIQFLRQSGVAAVVRSVRLADFETEALRERLRDASWLAAMATHHHEVIESIHRLRPILPVKFGCVYPDEDGVRTALVDLHEVLLARLQWVADCDEWTVYLYGDTTALERRLLQEHPDLQTLQHSIAEEAPGRAYLLKRKLADEVARVMEQATTELADQAYTRMSRLARSSAVQARNAVARDRQGETELLRAVFLVPRSQVAAFHDEVENISVRDAGMRGEYSGPWPPYSFATIEAEEERFSGQ